MGDRRAPVDDEPAIPPVLARVLTAAGLPATGRFHTKAGWVSRAWVGDDYVVRLGNESARDAYRHEAVVDSLLADSGVPHARHIAHGDGPDGPWYVSERVPGRTLFDVWPEADLATRKAIIESLGIALRTLHQVPVPHGLLPPWLADALGGSPWPAYHPPVVSEALGRVEAARQQPGHDPRLLSNVEDWIQERLALFRSDSLVLVHGDLHGSNLMVDAGRLTGLIDFAEAVAQPADVELDTILRWCARPSEFPPTPDQRGLDESSLAPVPGWLHGAYPELFDRGHLRERLNFYDMYVELAILAHHPDPAVRHLAQTRVTHLLAGRNHLDRLVW